MQIKVEELMSSMGGVLQSRTSADISFVIVKNVLAAKYKVQVQNPSRHPILYQQLLFTSSTFFL